MRRERRGKRQGGVGGRRPVGRYERRRIGEGGGEGRGKEGEEEGKRRLREGN